jgi:FkbM family methyltransferase
MLAKIGTLLEPLLFRFTEGRIKNLFRQLGYRFSHYLPYGMLVNKGDTVLDIGTPNPEIIEILRELVGPSGKVVVVEAEPKNIQKIQDYMKGKNWQNVHLIGKAAWREETVITFKVNKNPEDHKIPIDEILHDNDLVSEYIDEIKVNAIPLDSLTELTGKVDFIYLTVNGAELEVLKGATKILESSKARLYVKAHALVNGKPLNEKIVKFLNSHGYNAIITTTSKGIAEGWEERSGDVYGWKDK